MAHNVNHVAKSIHVGEAWFYLICNKQKVRVFPEKDKVGSVKVQRKSDIHPQAGVHLRRVASCRAHIPRALGDLDGKIGIW